MQVKLMLAAGIPDKAASTCRSAESQAFILQFFLLGAEAVDIQFLMKFIFG